ncbi:hypothetical protein AAE478_004885 [Parahypoxylon ruwenzoriense]
MDSDGEVDFVGTTKIEVASRGGQKKEPQQSIGTIGERFRKTAPHTHAAQRLEAVIKDVGSKMTQRSGDSSPDELAIDARDIAERMSTRRIVPHSPSLSKKGDISRTKFSASSHVKPQAPQKAASALNADMDRAVKIVGSGLRIVRAVSGQYGYDVESTSGANECLLRSLSVSHILHPTDPDGSFMEQYGYLLVNLQKTKLIQFSSAPDCRIVSISRATDASTSAAAKLMLEFPSPEDLRHFIKWAKISRVGHVSLQFRDDLSLDKLEKEFSHLMQKTTRSTVIRDGDTPSAEVADDIKLIEHNAVVRARQGRAAERPPSSTSQPKTRYLMRAPAPTPLPKPEVTVISDDLESHNGRRQLRTTRSTFGLKTSSDSDSPEPEGWSVRNKDWEKNWRNSIVFPPHGKSRAIVDKEDIPRLDEGQFLNDNLIVFYLRHLQHSLEANRPDLAQRIYFQNTFFYEKLKPTRAHQAIHYESVKAWTSKVDLFTKDYIIVPINECSHWYVAIIYNAPKLLPSSNEADVSDGARPKNAITIEDDAGDSRDVSYASPRSYHAENLTNEETVATTAQNDVVNNLSRMSINSPEPPNSETKQPIATGQEKQDRDVRLVDREQEVVEAIRGKDDPKTEAEQISPPNDNLSRRKPIKRHSMASRKHSPDQPRIITLDSLGMTHYPACNYLRQYLIAELKDKKGIEIPNPGSLGMTAKDVPQQTNHCDCGLYLLGYIQELLKAPDTFVRSLLQHDDDIVWGLDPSQLRNDIRELLFQLQKEQQEREDAHKEEKRKASLSKRSKVASEQVSPRQDASPAKEQAVEQHASEPVKEGAAVKEESVATPKMKSPVPQPSRRESRPSSSSVESHHIPGSFPRSPATEGAKARACPSTSPTKDPSDTKEIDTPKLISPLLDSIHGSSSTRPVVVDDSEVSQERTRGGIHGHGHGRGDYATVSSSIEVIIEPLQSRKDQNRPDIKQGKQKEAPTVSPFFAGRQAGDRMASAKLREEPTESRVVVDLSD